MLFTQYISGEVSSFSPKGRRTRRTSFNVQKPSPMPPCTTITRSPTRHTSGNWSKALWNRSNNIGPNSMPSLSRHSSLKPYFSFISRSSWFPRTNHTFSGKRTFKANNKPKTSKQWLPRSMKSPLKTKFGAPRSAGLPKARNSSKRSLNWPWMSPKILQGTDASTTVGCTAKILCAVLANSARVSMYSVLKRRTSMSDSAHSLSNTSWGSRAAFFAKFQAWRTTTCARFRTESKMTPRFMWDWIRFLFTTLSAIVVKSRTLAWRSLPVMTPQRVMTSGLDTVLARVSRSFGSESVSEGGSLGERMVEEEEPPAVIRGVG
mmetsp:Transcript_104570/g.301022  ORF Transcript_104570/g.301022 Transcript_104570/m.301022 type:complete len:319 (-) Transcript_104570:31-987(-)